MRGSLTRAQIANTHPRRECKVKPPFIFIISLRQPSNSISVSANTKPISINNVLFSSEHSIFSHMRDQMPLAFSRQAYKEALPMFFFFFCPSTLSRRASVCSCHHKIYRPRSECHENTTFIVGCGSAASPSGLVCRKHDPPLELSPQHMQSQTSCPGLCLTIMHSLRIVNHTEDSGPHIM